MIIDSSAFLAVYFEETDWRRYVAAMSDQQCSMSAANYVEAAIVADQAMGRRGHDEFDTLLAWLEIEIAPVTVAQTMLARGAYQRFGKGNHSAGLNFGDCFGYALSKDTGRPLLFKGEDFGKTDVLAAL